jgi:hypothetical protein
MVTAVAVTGWRKRPVPVMATPPLAWVETERVSTRIELT